MRFERMMVRLAGVVVLLTMIVLGSGVQANSITTPDAGELGGEYSSLVLDARGRPVIAYESGAWDMSLMTCNDANCAGEDETISRLDVQASFDAFPSLALGLNAWPVIVFQSTDFKLMLVVCNDSRCEGDDEVVVTLDDDGLVGESAQLALDENHYPVVVYTEDSGELRVIHCNDRFCQGDDESRTVVTYLDHRFGPELSMVLDGDGYPVIAAYNPSAFDLRVIRCNDANCAGDDESVTRPDATVNSGRYPSLALDGNGYPVVAYYDMGSSLLKVLHCNDLLCAGSDESITTPDGVAGAGYYPSLALDGDGYPVVAYHDNSNVTLKVLHCNDANCAGDDDPLHTVDNDGATGRNPDLVLDPLGFPVVSYQRITGASLKVLHCSNPRCEPNVAPVANAGPDLTVSEGDLVHFGGSGSDANGDPLAPSWLFGDGTRPVEGEFVTTHVYGDDGVYSAMFTVTDTGGLSDSDRKVVTVLNAPPAVQVDGGSLIYAEEGEALSFNATVHDPGADDTHTIVWDFGDGITVTETLSPTHTYVNEGAFLLSLTVTDDDGGVGSDFVSVAVVNVAPAVEAGDDQTVTEGTEVTFAGSFTDPGVEDEHTIVWDFGDGETAEGTLTPVHTFAAAGVYTVTLQVSDESLTGEDWLVVTVLAEEPDPDPDPDPEPEVQWVFLPVFRQ